MRRRAAIFCVVRSLADGADQADCVPALLVKPNESGSRVRSCSATYRVLLSARIVRPCRRAALCPAPPLTIGQDRQWPGALIQRISSLSSVVQRCLPCFKRGYACQAAHAAEVGLRRSDGTNSGPIDASSNAETARNRVSMIACDRPKNVSFN